MSRASCCRGFALRAAHQHEFLQRRPAVGWVEVHSENYFARGGAQRAALAKVRELYPLSLHGVGLSLGSTDPLDSAHLAQLVRLARELDPALVSEHLSWGSIDERFMNDLLPLPYTEEALRHTANRIKAVQDALGRQILIENVSSYLEFEDSTFPEWEFLVALSVEAGCAILLDVNNLYVNAVNHGFDPYLYLKHIPRGAVQEIHLAGHSVQRAGKRAILIDTHAEPVCTAVWRLYGATLERFGPVRTLIEWDTGLPCLDTLLAEGARIEELIETRHADAA
jgi:uncharacterized protein (UPF0276 family)